MQAEVLSSLRELRSRVQRLRASIVDDLKAFLRDDLISFRRLPDSDEKEKKSYASVATTSSVLMALSLSGKLGDVYKKKTVDGDKEKPVDEDRRKTVDDAVALMMASPWDSSELPPDNAFTRAILLRTLGMLVEHKALDRAVVTKLKKKEPSPRERAQKLLLQLKEKDKEIFQGFCAEAEKLTDRLPDSGDELTIEGIAQKLALELPESLRVLKYPPTPTLGYWFVAGVEQLGIALAKTPEEAEKLWEKLALWARDDVAKQMALITSNHEARMDPVAMAMAACLAARLRRLALKDGSPASAKLVGNLPTQEELRTAVRLLFAKQGKSGIWPKYFPLFHYPSAGSNYCFSFELLEAILHELMVPEFLMEPAILDGFQKAVSWCEENRLEHLYGNEVYRGWNSGGELTTLSQGIPESWATAVIHMFAYELESALDAAIEDLVLRKYRAKKPLKAAEKKFNEFINIHIKPQGGAGDRDTVKDILREEIIEPAREAEREAKSKRIFRLQRRWSALLFGPPGTSKTSLVKAVAAYLGWPYVEINPSDFLKRGLEHLPIQADEIFEDLMDLSKAVVLFDEMDAIVKRREQKPRLENDKEQWRLDPTSELLTTSMLPKLAYLHGKAQVIFFFATNHREDLDSAITRPGRFDIWLCMGPPNWSEKLANLNIILERFSVPNEAVTAATKILETETTVAGNERNKAIAGYLNYFTFAEVQSFLEYICRKEKKPIQQIGSVLETLNREDLRNWIKEWYDKDIILREGSSIRREYDQDFELSKLQ